MPIGSTTLNIGEFRKDADGLLSLPTSTDSRLPQFSLTLNCGEKPRIPNPTKLSEILEPSVDPKYNLSARACQGILNRAARRGKELPKALLDALTEQAGTNSGAANVPEGASLEMDGAEILPAEPFPSKNELAVTGGARESFCNVSGQEPCQPSETNPCFSIQGNVIDRDAKMNGGGYCQNVAHTLNSVDKHGVSFAVDCRNGTENPFVNGTLQAKEQGMNLNSNNVVRVPNQQAKP